MIAVLVAPAPSPSSPSPSISISPDEALIANPDFHGKIFLESHLLSQQIYATCPLQNKKPRRENSSRCFDGYAALNSWLDCFG